MTDLATLQQSFQHYLRHQDGAGILTEIVNDAALSAQQRLAVYHEGYYLRLIEILENDFVVLARLLGEESFSQMARAYIHDFPSQYRNIQYVGCRLSEFLARSPVYHEHSLWRELATFEWALEEARIGEQATSVSIAQLAELAPDAWGELSFVLHPTLKVLRLHHNAVEYYQASYAEQAWPELLTHTELQACIVWRKQFAAHYRYVNSAEAWMLGVVLAGERFAQICAGLCDFMPEEEVAPYALGRLQQWFADGLITRLCLAE